MSLNELSPLQIDRPAPLEAGPSAASASYRRVLVPLDGSPVAEQVLPMISKFAQPLGLEIALLRVVPHVSAQVVEATRHLVVDVTERLRLEAEDYLNSVAEGLRVNGLQALTAVRIGDVATEILAAARECQADVIAMTTQGRSALGRLIFGSVAEAVLHRAEMPVFLVRAMEAEHAKHAA